MNAQKQAPRLQAALPVAGHWAVIHFIPHTIATVVVVADTHSDEIKFQEIDQILQAFIETFPYEWLDERIEVAGER